MSLLEVIVAMAIFLISLVAISRLTDVGNRQAVEVDLRSQAALIAQSKLAELSSGVLSLTSQSDTPLDDDPDWTWSVEDTADNIPGLHRVRVTVWRETNLTGRVSVTLSQYVLDPTKRGGTESMPAEPQ